MSTCDVYVDGECLELAGLHKDTPSPALALLASVWRRWSQSGEKAFPPKTLDHFGQSGAKSLVSRGWWPRETGYKVHGK